MTQTIASCLCGQVRIAAKGEPIRTGICHCNDCKKHHGALFYAAAIFPEKAVRITGETSSFQGRHFCPTCGSSLFAVSGGEVEIHLGCIDGPEAFAPTYECWTARRAHWLPDIEGMAQYPKDRTPSAIVT